jgi:hypothetical protein
MTFLPSNSSFCKSSNKYVRDCLVTGYQSLIPALTLPDSGDRHVLAAAIRCNADIIVTFNRKDFPKEYLTSYGIEAQHPDEFIRHLLDLNSAMVCQAAEKHRRTLKKPPKTTEEYLDTLLRQGLSQTALNLRDLMLDSAF